MVSKEKPTYTLPKERKKNSVFGHFDKRTPLDGDLVERRVSTLCCSFSLLVLILFLAAETSRLNSLAGKVGVSSRSSVLVLYFLFSVTKLLPWLFLREQYITRAASVHLNQELLYCLASAEI